MNDGRNICGYCLFDFVDENQKLDKAFQHVVSVYNKAKVYLPLERIDLKLCNQSELHTTLCKNPMGLTHTLKSSWKKNKYRIEVLSANYTFVVNTIAHELMHVVQDELNLSLNRQRSEGLSECAAYLVLQTLKSDIAKEIRKRIENNSNTIYGDGFRLVRAEIMRAGSLQKFISHL